VQAAGMGTLIKPKPARTENRIKSLLKDNYTERRENLPKELIYPNKYAP